MTTARAASDASRRAERFKGRPVAELEAHFRGLVESNQRIQAQLSNQDRAHGDGSPMSDAEFEAWRTLAVGALRHGLAEQRAAKEALKTARRRFNMDTPLRPASELDSPDALIHAALVVLRHMASEVEVDDDEQQVIDALDAHLRNGGKVGA